MLLLVASLILKDYTVLYDVIRLAVVKSTGMKMLSFVYMSPVQVFQQYFCKSSLPPLNPVTEKGWVVSAITSCSYGYTLV